MEDLQISLNEQLCLAAQAGNKVTVEELITSGANIHAFDDLQLTALHYAVQSGNQHLVHWLIQQGSNVNSHNANSAGETPLSLAAESGHLGITKLLLGLGADPYLKDWMWLDALDRADKREDEIGEKIRELILRECPPPKERLERDFKRR